MSVYVGIGVNLCVNGVVSDSVNEIYKEWYGSVDVTEMDTVSVLNNIIDVRDGGVLVLFKQRRC